MDNKCNPCCALCGTDDPLFNMWIIVTLQLQGNVTEERLCPCCGTHYDRDPRLLQKAAEGIDDGEAAVGNQLFFSNC